MTVEFLTPVGRVVQGHPLDKQDKNMQGQPLMTQSGQPTQRFFVALAFQKTDASFGQLFGLMQQVAQASFPGMVLLPPSDPRCRFSWKIADGDGMDDNNKPNANKPGFAGCWVVKFQSSYVPKCYYAGKYRPEDQITDPKFIKRGWYARIAGTIEGNGQANKPGLYMNLSSGCDDVAGDGADPTRNRSACRRAHGPRCGAPAECGPFVAVRTGTGGYTWIHPDDVPF